MMDRRGFLSLLGASIATPALAKTAGGVILPMEQQVITGRLVLSNLLLSGLTIENCVIECEDGPAMIVQGCHFKSASNYGVVNTLIEYKK
jgi:hypothetical protein